MSTSNTITKTDLENIINAIFPATSEDMTQAQIDAFVASLQVNGGGSPTTSTYTASSLSHFASASVSLTRLGKIGVVYVGARNTSSNLAVGGDATLQIDDFPAVACYCNGVGYSGSTCLVGSLSPTGFVRMRVTGSAWVASYDVSMIITVIFA